MDNLGVRVVDSREGFSVSESFPRPPSLHLSRGRQHSIEHEEV